MKRRIIVAFLISIMIVSTVGCGAATSNEITEEREQIVINDVTEEDTESEETEQTELMDEVSNEQIYSEILDMYYYKIDAGWDDSEDVSDLFLVPYSDVKKLSDAGYVFLDLDNNGVSELLVSSVEAAERGVIYDLYTYSDGEIIHILTGGERYIYSLCNDNSIYYEGSGGAALSSNENYVISGDGVSLSLREIVLYDEYKDEDNPWFFGTSECYDEVYGYNYDDMNHISSEEANELINAYENQIISFEITPFDRYSPSTEMSSKDMIKKAFKTQVDSGDDKYLICDDFDADGNLEGFGITGNDNGWDLENVKVYIVDCNGNVSCIDEFESLYGYGGGYCGTDNFAVYSIIDTGSNKFLALGGNEGQKTWLYGVKNGQVYQPEVSGQHDCFSKSTDGLYCGQPNEGGPGYYQLYYEYDVDSGEFVPSN